MPRFATRSIRKSGVSDALLKKYEKYVQRIDDDSIGSLKFRESEDISVARKALRTAGKKLGRDLIIRRPRGINNVLQFWLPDKKRATGEAGSIVRHDRLVRERTIEIWRLNRDETDHIFDGPHSVVCKWRQSEVFSEALAELDAATALLYHYLKPDRIPAVVRKAIPARGDVSLIEMLEAGDAKTLIATCRDMFRFEQVHA